MVSNKLQSILLVALCGASMVYISAGETRAQNILSTGLRHTITARQMINNFENVTGASVVINGDLDEDTKVVIPAQGFANRRQELDTLALALQCNWTKIYLVTPATQAHSTISISDAKYFTDGQGRVAFSAQSLPAAAAIAAVAQADGATAMVSGTLPTRAISLNTQDMSVPQAIATVSAQTNTNWRLTYRMTPKTDDERSAAAGSKDGVVIPLYMRRVHNKDITDATQVMPGYYAPFKVHAPANPITYQPYGVVMYNPSEEQSLPVMNAPQVYDPSGTGLVSSGYGAGAGYYAGAYGFNPFITNPLATPGLTTAPTTTTNNTAQSLMNSTPVTPTPAAPTATSPSSTSTTNTGTVVH